MPDIRSLRRAAIVAAGMCAAVAAARVATAQATPAADDNVRRLRVYHERIVETSKTLGPRASLADLVRPVIELARDRSATGHAAEENRRALMALTFYVNGWDVAMLVPEARDWPRPARHSLALRGRADLARHFIVSALLAAAGGTPFAAAAGLYKELSDARGESGFSFSDLAANRAGEQFGAAAARSDESARRLQERVARGLRESDMMPPIDGLADNLSEAELVRRFGGVGGPAYNDVVGDIDRRVAALALFQ